MIFDENQANRWLTIRQIWGMVRVKCGALWPLSNRMHMIAFIAHGGIGW